jgi:membrane protease YdiL (CAAX protease family)
VAAVLLYLTVFFGSSIALYAVGAALPDTVEGTFGVASLGVAEGLALLTVFGVWVLVDQRPIAQLGLRRQHAVRRWLKGAAIATLMMGFVVLVGYTLIDGAAWDVNPDATRAAFVLVAGLVGFAVQGPAEEVLFRGYVLENLKDQWGSVIAVLVSSVAFAVFHAANPAFGVLPLVNLFLFGVATALYKLRLDGNQLWGVFAMHTVWNWLQQVVFGLPNSGLASAPGNTLFTVTPPSDLAAPLSGGGFGPEGTLAGSLVLLALIFVSLRVKPRSALMR